MNWGEKLSGSKSILKQERSAIYKMNLRARKTRFHVSVQLLSEMPEKHRVKFRRPCSRLLEKKSSA
jgi:hypothetical protein